MKLLLKSTKQKPFNLAKTIDMVNNINIHKHDIFVIRYMYKQNNSSIAVIVEF